ncbi:MAG: hypothetical protein KDI30_07015 [Pseudomonadales bacterium]|nr:hypothetical protein [Pseudomonadales bacterium]
MAKKLPAIMVDTSVLVSHFQQYQCSRFQNAEHFPHLFLGDFIKREYHAVFADCLAGLQASVVASPEGQARLRQTPLIRQLIWELHSPTTLRHLASVSGTQALLPDPFLVGGGIESWNNQKIQLPFLRHPVTDLYPVLRVEILLAAESHAPSETAIRMPDEGESSTIKTMIPGQLFLSAVKELSAIRSTVNGSAWSLVAFFYINDRARSLEERQKAFEDY